MRVHIVAAGGDRILPRLARVLANGAGWSISARLDSRAQVNIWMPYLNRVNARCETKQAAWFTHREVGSAEKANVWDMVAQAVDIRVTSARIYLPNLRHHGPTFLVTPPLDREKFQPVERLKQGRTVIGTSGWVYQWGRKGEDLLAGLVKQVGDRDFEWRASGEGWPVPTKMYEWKRQQEFYQDLDAYVCTSTVEGVGYGPLEALACGVPVVIPSGVGVFDDLPEMSGVRHYRAGDLKDLHRAFTRLMSDVWTQDDLRALTEPYTVDTWVGGWRAAIESLSSGLVAPSDASTLPALTVPPEKKLEDWHGRAGLYVVAFGEPSRACAVKCIKSFQQHNPDVPVALCSDRPLGPETLLIQRPERDIGARNQKVSIYDLAPSTWEYVLYLDADTEAKAPLGQMLDWLQAGWELVICTNPGKFAVAGNMKRADNLTECEETWKLWGSDQTLQLQGGVFAFRRCEATKKLFQRWHAEWERYGKRDQAALLRAIWHEPVKTWLLLPNVWNCVPAYDDPRKATIEHHPQTARRWEGIVYPRADSPEAWQRVKEWERAHGKAASHV